MSFIEKALLEDTPIKLVVLGSLILAAAMFSLCGYAVHGFYVTQKASTFLLCMVGVSFLVIWKTARFNESEFSAIADYMLACCMAIMLVVFGIYCVRESVSVELYEEVNNFALSVCFAITATLFSVSILGEVETRLNWEFGPVVTIIVLLLVSASAGLNIAGYFYGGLSKAVIWPTVTSSVLGTLLVIRWYFTAKKLISALNNAPFIKAFKIPYRMLFLPK